MSAQHIYDFAPLGSIIATSDGAPSPSACLTRKVKAWERSNGSGRLIARTPARTIGRFTAAASLTLDRGAATASGVVLVSFHQIYNLTSRLRFEIVERPPVGAVRVLSSDRVDAELYHLAASWRQAEEWLRSNAYSGAALQEVTATELAARPAGRAA